MQLIRAKDYDEMCAKAAEHVIRTIKEKKAPVLGLATGKTPTGVYRKLVMDHWQNRTSYRHVTTFNLDEYVGLGSDDPTSFHYYMRENFFDHVDIPEQQIHIPNGIASNLEQECLQYECQIEEKGGIDLQILGIGVNGHIGFNEPGTPFYSQTHIVKLSESTREANQSFFNSLEQVPKYAITMGLSTIMKSREIVLLVSGKRKAPILQQLLSSEVVCEDLPATILKRHPHVTIITDQDAYSS
ncbi:glucosamine-6-phosphate deaminase [Thermoactinomyces mirandus]|uniref:Glucosamine-6-phosphate deaminase n=1 Tax=Thermoactinomyces mirandus TaxID=2756294 RepID=A0A7W1XSW8_9BACL|nr:glucosamine-6-phosphate deaminase [Thermoactinomyces mirandus]MBA4602595.1 glucosamine-6-phosphate deaminase [Thermoactinomyces mirandus]